MGYEEVFAGHVLPVVRFRRTVPGEYEPVRAVGSGFTFGEGTFVTCWHCVSEPLGDGEVYGAADRQPAVVRAPEPRLAASRRTDPGRRP